MVRVIFLHPDLGIGGAERAVIDIALALKSSGYDVLFVTAHHDPSHCFPETSDGTLTVKVVGDWLPRSIFGKFNALFAYLRMIVAAIFLVLFANSEYDYVFCDQISACIPVLRLRKQKIIFYCHFPDMLLTTRQSLLKKLYRALIDWIEEKSTGLAHRILVNSNFTANIFRDTFTSLRNRQLQVLYPIPNFSTFDKPTTNEGSHASQSIEEVIPMTAKNVFLSLNRYTRAKNHALAINALDELRKDIDLDSAGVHLVITGGYDSRMTENIDTYNALVLLADKLNLTRHVTFIKSCPNDTKLALLRRCACLVYTPEREHFGIVPVEAMYARRPVIAVNSGGPRETVADGQTGFLCEPLPKEFASAMGRIVAEEGLGKSMGDAGYARVMELFSMDAFTRQLLHIFGEMDREK